MPDPQYKPEAQASGQQTLQYKPEAQASGQQALRLKACQKSIRLIRFGQMTTRLRFGLVLHANWLTKQ
jgi:uncharacterized beta-barrel protein YwiB (DUF1934 family)